MDARTRKIITYAMMAAIAYVVMALIRIPVVMFLKYEPKDVIIVIAGFLFGPVSGGLVGLLVGLFLAGYIITRMKR